MEDRRCRGGGEGSVFGCLKISPLGMFASCINKEMPRRPSIRFELYIDLLQLGGHKGNTGLYVLFGRIFRRSMGRAQSCYCNVILYLVIIILENPYSQARAVLHRDKSTIRHSALQEWYVPQELRRIG
jgi:hypothetical protein